MKSPLIFYVFFIFALWVTSCSNIEKKKEHFDGEELIEYSSLLSIKENTDSFLISVKNTDNSIISKYYINKKQSQPFNKIVSLSSVFTGFICEIGAQDLIVSVDNVNFLSNENLIKRNKNGNLPSVSLGGTVNTELLINLKPDLILHSGYGEISEVLEKKLSSLDIPLFLCNNYLEESPLGRAEWVKAFGILCGKKEYAFELFKEIESEYNKLKQRDFDASPKILVGIVFGGIWDVPASQSYTAQLIQDAGGLYLWKDQGGAGRIPLNIESIAQKALNADIWLNPGAYKNLATMQNDEPRYTDFKPFKQKMIFNNNKQVNSKGGNAFWETAPVRPHVVLQDLITIFNYDSTANLIYYQKLE